MTPGFIDVHTHLDAQVFWDQTLSPSPLHGVTTVIGGNCGFTIAPLGNDPAHGDYLMRMLARVEGIPLEALQQGVPWSWQTTAEYLDAIDGNVAVNAGFKVGHSALRRVVMGDDSVRRASTGAELEAMKALLRDGLEAGALGFSSSWSRTHNDPMGNMVPSRYAERDELVALCSVLADFDGTSVEFIPALGPFEDWALELMSDMSVAARSPLNWNVMTVTARSMEMNRAKLAAGDHAAARGGKVVALTVPQMLSLHLNFNSGFVLDALPGWEQVMLLPKEDKRRVLADPAERRRLNELAQGDHPLRALAHWERKVVFHSPAPENEGCAGRTVGEIATERGQDPVGRAVRHRPCRRPGDVVREPGHFRARRRLGGPGGGMARPEGGDRSLRRRGAPRPVPHRQLRNHHAERGSGRAGAAAAGGGGAPAHRGAGQSVRPSGQGSAGRGGLRRCRCAR